MAGRVEEHFRNMKTKEELLKKLDEIIQQEERDKNRNVSQWATESLNIIKQCVGTENDFYIQLNKGFAQYSKLASGGLALLRQSEQSVRKICIGVVKAFKESIQGDWLKDQREVLRGEIYSDLTELGRILLEDSNEGYQPAAVIFGMVLEDKLRKLCQKHQIFMDDKETIEALNMKLYNKDVYEVNEKDRVTIVGRVRNHAGHARWDKFTKSDVEETYRIVIGFKTRYD